MVKIWALPDELLFHTEHGQCVKTILGHCVPEEGLDSLLWSLVL